MESRCCVDGNVDHRRSHWPELSLKNKKESTFESGGKCNLGSEDSMCKGPEVKVCVKQKEVNFII